MLASVLLLVLLGACTAAPGGTTIGGGPASATPQATVQPRPADATNKPAPSKAVDDDPYGYGY